MAGNPKAPGLAPRGVEELFRGQSPISRAPSTFICTLQEAVELPPYSCVCTQRVVHTQSAIMI